MHDTLATLKLPVIRPHIRKHEARVRDADKARGEAECFISSMLIKAASTLRQHAKCFMQGN